MTIDGSQKGPAEDKAGFLTRLRRLFSAREGVGAVEFTLVAPILLIIYLMSFEITVAVSLSRKVSHASSDVADLVTQKSSVDTTYLSTMTNVAKAVIAPYNANGLVLKISGITIDSTSKATIAWSWKSDGSRPYTVGSTVTVPSDLLIANSFLVHSEVSMPYSLLLYLPGMNGSSTQTLNLSKEFFFRQRVGSSITCSNC